MLKRPKHTHTLCDALTVYTLAIETTRDVEFLDYRNSSMEHNVLSFFFFFAYAMRYNAVLDFHCVDENSLLKYLLLYSTEERESYNFRIGE